MKRLWLVRHGTVHNPDRVLYRRLPGFHLSSRGREEAEEAARFLRGEPLEAVWHSPLERAVETAEIISRPHGAPLRVDERIHEWAEGEPPEEVAGRMRSFLEDWLAGPESVAAAVSHRDPIRALLHALDASEFAYVLDSEPPYPLRPGGIYRIEKVGDSVTAVCVRHTP